MIAWTLAYRNLKGAGLRTWLNGSILSLVFVLILFINGMLDGWNQSARQDTADWEIGEGQFWAQDFDPLDPFSYQEGLKKWPQEAEGVPILWRQGSIYPDGRMYPLIIKGIPAQQKLLALPTALLAQSKADFPALIGRRMAKNCQLKVGDRILLRWRDQKGSFDAQEVEIVAIFDSPVAAVDQGQIWVDLANLQAKTGLQEQANLFVAAKANQQPIAGALWQDKEKLLAPINKIIASKKGSSQFSYYILLGIALLALFDTQVLSIFKRQKEIGTYISLGMTPAQVQLLFTLEGGLYAILGILLGGLYGGPLLYYFAQNGIPMPAMADEMGVSMGKAIYPVYSLGLLLQTVLIILGSSFLVSYWPARKIAGMSPVAALKGKLQ
ncbi:FtsX-like permease family protein [Saprospira sp. CCB-QB6]|uniref:ABC transporter permease n=1 Tax=Saprospira sp. CCB-QB6 TaxID=3023936 RepID=UPI002349520B|nr:FtsX-like permease family protein [Saprospira sp. CCB-QB6]WCL80654.1 FtsX-like permease family protein [Saprospira sp. CCB-QB6]